MKVQRDKCKHNDCNYDRQESIPFAKGCRTYTHRFVRNVVDLLRSMTLKDASARLNVNWDTVKEIPSIYLKVSDVMPTSLGQFIRMYNATQTAKCMKLISKEVDALRCTISEVRCFCIITIRSHITTFTTGYTAHFYRLGIYAEEILTSIHLLRHTAAYLFQKIAYRLAAVMELTARDEIRKLAGTFFQLGFKQPVLTVYPFRFCSHTQCDDFQIRKAGNGTWPETISFLCD